MLGIFGPEVLPTELFSDEMSRYMKPGGAYMLLSLNPYNVDTIPVETRRRHFANVFRYM